MSTRAMIAGVTGMQASGLKMDTIGNNIANLNTVGFKSSKALFSTLLSQTISGGTAGVSGGTGGTNPIQTGLGVKLGTVQKDFTQGSLFATGKVTDLAISKKGFFVLSNSDETLYTRDGAFSLDTNNNLVNPANGFKLQGWNADGDGVISTLGLTGDIVIPTGSETIASATSLVTLVGNLNSGGDNGVAEQAQSGIAYSSSTIIDANRATSSTALTSLYSASGTALNLEAGDVLTVSGTKGAGTITTRTFTVGTTGSTLGDLADFMEETFGIVGDTNTGVSEGVTISGTASGETAGRLVVTSNIGDVNRITEIEISGTDTAGGSVTMSTSAFQQIFGPDVGNNGFDQVTVGDGESTLTQFNVYDSTGLSHTVNLAFARVSSTEWSYFATADDNFSAGSTGTGVVTAAGTLNFAASGAFTSFSGANFSINLDNGATTPLTVTLDATEVTQLGTTSSINLANQNGFPPGNLTNFTIGQTGVITGIFSNGLTRDLAQIGMASFVNDEGLLEVGNNMFSAAVNSGAVDIGEALQEGRGSINSGFLENSNVELAQEFSQMILTQRAFQANARTISTADALLAEAVNLV